MASIRERLPRHTIGQIFAIGIALLSLPAAAQNLLQGGQIIQADFSDRSARSAATPHALYPYGKNIVIQRNTASSRIPSGEPFALSTTALAKGEPLAHTWRGIQAEALAEMAKLALCRDQSQTCSLAAQKLNRIVTEGRSRSGLARIGVINRAINLAIKPTDEPYKWRSPLDALSAGEGDCKDYAVTKYFALLEAGFAEPDVKLVIVHDLRVDQDHAIVAVHFDGDWIILDNRWLALVRDFELRRATPLYVLDADGVSRFGQPKAQSNSSTRAGFTPVFATFHRDAIGPGR